MYKLLVVLYKIKLLSPLGLYRLFSAICKYGINLMTLLCFAERVYGNKIALVDDHETLSYKELLSQSEQLSSLIKQKYGLNRGQKVGVLCKNHSSLVKVIFAVSITGADLYLLNAEMSKSKLDNLFNHHDFKLIVYDFELSALMEGSSYTKAKILSYHDDLLAINNLHNMSINPKPKLQKASMGKIIMLTGGTTGNSKIVEQQPSLFNFLNPFLTLITKLKLLNYNTAYIATPIYHGYGVALLFVFITLGKKIVINNGFDAKKACCLIREHKVEVVIVVPLMIHKMLGNNAEDLKSLHCIASGGAKLSPKLVAEIFSELGDVLYNLYGTSEAGLNMIATPQDLKYAPTTIGKKIEGVELRILDNNKNKIEIGNIGQFCIKNKWSMRNNKKSWVETGDLGYQNNKGHYFLCGRVDDMVVSAGENIFPIEVEQVLIKHPQVEDVAVIGINDENFGQRLKAFVLLTENADATKEEILEWLRSRVARFQVPKEIIFVDSMPYTPLGKLDKKQLR